MIPVVYILVGLAGLILGSSIAVRHVKTLARALGLSELSIGLTIAAIGTSLPEIATNLGVAFNALTGPDASSMAVGNIMGSCLSQITLLLGITALVAPLTADRLTLRRDGTMAGLALALMFVVSLDGLVYRWEGGILVAVYLAYLAFVWHHEVTDDKKGDATPKSNLWSSIAKMTGGIAIVVVSADLLVDGSVALARASGVSELVLGLGVGVATGLPELVLSVRGVQQRAHGFAIGNLIGSNITDPLLSFGLGAAVRPVAVPATVLWIDFPAWAGATAIAIALLATRRGVNRPAGVVLVLGFLGYAVAQAFR